MEVGKLENKAVVKAYIPVSLARALARECQSCGCSQSAVIGQAILERVQKMAAIRRTRALVLPGQIEIEGKISNASN
jgi:hypothetical protein